MLNVLLLLLLLHFFLPHSNPTTTYHLPKKSCPKNLPNKNPPKKVRQKSVIVVKAILDKSFKRVLTHNLKKKENACQNFWLGLKGSTMQLKAATLSGH